MNYMTYCIIIYVISQVKITKKHTFFAKILHFLRKFSIFCENSPFFAKISSYSAKTR